MKAIKQFGGIPLIGWRVLAVFAGMSLALCVQAQIVQQAHLPGQYVAISGNTAVLSDSGSARVYVRQGNDWVFQDALQIPDAYYPYEVAISGDTVAIGALARGSDAEYSNPGSVYVFVRDGVTWGLQAKFRASNASAGDFFCHVAICEDTIVVGATEESSNSVGVNGDQNNRRAPRSGAAYVFFRTGTNWTQQAYLKASNANAGDVLGYTVGISGDTIVVGAPGESSNATDVNGEQSDNSAPGSGAAYVFVREGTMWSQQAYLKAPPPGAASVSISGDTVVADHYVFVRSGTNWSRQAYIEPTNFHPADGFAGWKRVAISGDLIVAGAWGEDSNATGINGDQNNNSATDSGAAYVFERKGTNWNQTAYLKASPNIVGDYFGHTVAVSEGTVIIAAGNSGASIFAGFDTGTPRLNIERQGDTFVLSWPLGASEWLLEQSEDMEATSWILIPAPYQSDGTGYIHNATISDIRGFFRLREP